MSEAMKPLIPLPCPYADWTLWTTCQNECETCPVYKEVVRAKT